MTTEFQHEQRERRQTLENDRKVREQERRDNTMLGRTDPNLDLGGRFLQSEGHAQVIGQSGAPTYPQLPASSPWSGTQPEPGIEPPLGLDNPALDETSTSPSVEVTGAPVPEAPSPGVRQPLADDVETGAGAPPSSEQTND
jgi:hypothetical protein